MHPPSYFFRVTEGVQGELEAIEAALQVERAEKEKLHISLSQQMQMREDVEAQVVAQLSAQRALLHKEKLQNEQLNRERGRTLRALIIAHPSTTVNTSPLFFCLS